MFKLFKSPLPGKASQPYRVLNAIEWKKLGQYADAQGKKPPDETSDVASDAILILSSIGSRHFVLNVRHITSNWLLDPHWLHSALDCFYLHLQDALGISIRPLGVFV